MKVVAFERGVQGTSVNRRLHNSDKTPAIIYDISAELKLIELDHNALYHALKEEAFHSSIPDIEVAGKVEEALLRDFQPHPFKQLILHIDFQRVSTEERVHVKVSLHFLNQETAPGMKLDHGIVNHILNDVGMSCLSIGLPEFIEVGLGTLEIDQTLHIVDLKLPKGVTIPIHGGNENPTVASISVPAGEESAAAGEGAAIASEDKSVA